MSSARVKHDVIDVTPVASSRARDGRRLPAVTAKTKAMQARKVLFLQNFCQVGVVTAAAKMTGVARQQHYEWYENDPEYARQFEDAAEQANDRLETEMIRRGLQGWDEPVYGMVKGETKQVGVIRKYSDRMLELALRARRPKQFRDRVDLTGPDGGPLQAKVLFFIPENGRRREDEEKRLTE